jgi:raffinose/stachyose/melibiose transport system substrate-binding protein
MGKRRIVTAIAIGLAMLLTLTACGSSPTQTAASTQQPSTNEASKLSGDLTYWAMWNETEPQAEVIKAAINDFKAANPGVNVKVQWNGRDIRKTLKAALDAGQGIDIFENDPAWITKNLGINYALKLDDYFAKTYATTDGKVFKDTIIPVITTWISSFSKGQGLYYVPNQAYNVGIYYSKDAFQKANIDKAPQTWDEFLSACKQLKAAGYAPLTVDDAYMELLMGQYLGMEKGDAWVSKLMQDKTGAMWDDPAVLQFAKAYEDLYKKGYISKNAAGNKYPAGQQELGLGKAAMYLNGSWLPNELASTTGPNFKWGAFSFPNIPNATENNTAMTFGANSYAINKNCKNADAAFELLTYIVCKKTQNAFSEKAASMPVTLDTNWPAALSDVKQLFEGATKNLAWACNLGDGGDFEPIALAEFTKLISGKVTAEKFVSNMKAAAKK